MAENGGTRKSASTTSLLKECIYVISCCYEDETKWGKEVLILINHLKFLTLQSCSKCSDCSI
uniref:Uncharacterized protein n=1 Tax=Solanum lycopersicum TaxID=4081 RepID=A0A3Q7HAR1_SOLLC